MRAGPSTRAMTMTEPDAAPPGTMRQLRRVGGLVWAERRPYLAGSVFVALSICTALAYPYVIRLIIDDAIQGGQLQRLNQLSLMMVGILLRRGAVDLRARLLLRARRRARRRARCGAWCSRRCSRRTSQFFDSRDTGEITTRLWADVPPLEYVLGEEFAETLRAAVFSVCGTGLLFYTSPRLTLLMLLGVPPIVFATSLLGRRVKMLAADVQAAHAEAGAAAAEVLAGIRTVRAFSQEAAEARALRRPDRAGARVRAAEGAGAGAARRRVAHRRRVRGAARHLGRRPPDRRRPHDDRRAHLVHPVRAVRGPRVPQRVAVHGRSDCARSARRSGCSTCSRGSRAFRLDGGARPAFDGSVALERVRFRYPTRPDVEALRGIDLRIAPGEVVAARRQVRLGQVDAAQPDSPLLRSARGARARRRPRRARPRSDLAPRRDRDRHAGADAVLADRRREHQLRRRRRVDRGGPSIARRGWRAPTSSSIGCPAATTRRSATAACSCRAGSASGWRSRARCCGVRRF